MSNNNNHDIQLKELELELKKHDIELKKQALELDRHKKEIDIQNKTHGFNIAKYFITGIVLIIGFAWIKPGEQNRLDHRLSLEIAKLYAEDMPNKDLKVWQRRLNLLEDIEKNKSIEEFIASEKNSLEIAKGELKTLDDNNFVLRLGITDTDINLKEYNEAVEKVNSSEEKLTDLGIEPSQKYQYAFAIVGTSPNLPEAQSFAERLAKETQYQPTIFKVKQFYVTQLGENLSLEQAEQRVFDPEVRKVAPDAFVFQSYSRRHGKNLFRRPKSETTN